jgi:hypothetical protein
VASFAARCKYATAACLAATPPEVEVGAEQYAACK